jgi:hypothetical protein
MSKASLSERSDHYRPRNLQSSQYYQCIEDNFATLEHVYDERFNRQYGRHQSTHVCHRWRSLG